MLEKIGGFSEWNLVEDLHTTYVANALGYRSIYVTQPYVLGLAPSDLRAVYKQRGTWALDTLRIFFWQHPMFNLKLTLRQRLHYLEMCYSYLVSGIFLTAVYFINFYTLLSDDLLHVGGWWYVVFRLPALIFTLMLFNRFSQGQLTSRIWAGMWPVYAKATILALMHRRTKPLYRVTPKIDNGVRELSLVVPQIMMIIIGYSCIVIHLAVYGPTQILYFSTFWTVVMSYWMWAIIMKAAKAGIFKHERAKPAAANVVS
jgi:cellulose synthase (UDP-forming)